MHTDLVDSKELAERATPYKIALPPPDRRVLLCGLLHALDFAFRLISSIDMS